MRLIIMEILSLYIWWLDFFFFLVRRVHMSPFQKCPSVWERLGSSTLLTLQCVHSEGGRGLPCLVHWGRIARHALLSKSLLLAGRQQSTRNKSFFSSQYRPQAVLPVGRLTVLSPACEWVGTAVQLHVVSHYPISFSIAFCKQRGKGGLHLSFSFIFPFDQNLDK
jgi:hypothetical protein